MHRQGQLSSRPPGRDRADRQKRAANDSYAPYGETPGEVHCREAPGTCCRQAGERADRGAARLLPFMPSTTPTRTRSPTTWRSFSRPPRYSGSFPARRTSWSASCGRRTSPTFLGCRSDTIWRSTRTPRHFAFFTSPYSWRSSSTTTWCFRSRTANISRHPPNLPRARELSPFPIPTTPITPCIIGWSTKIRI